MAPYAAITSSCPLLHRPLPGWGRDSLGARHSACGRAAKSSTPARQVSPCRRRQGVPHRPSPDQASAIGRCHDLGALGSPPPVATFPLVRRVTALGSALHWTGLGPRASGRVRPAWLAETTIHAHAMPDCGQSALVSFGDLALALEGRAAHTCRVHWFVLSVHRPSNAASHDVSPTVARS